MRDLWRGNGVKGDKHPQPSAGIADSQSVNTIPKRGTMATISPNASMTANATSSFICWACYQQS